MTQRQELSQIIIAISELRDKSPYKKTYENVLKTLKRKLERAKFEGKIEEPVHNPKPTDVSMVESLQNEGS